MSAAACRAAGGKAATSGWTCYLQCSCRLTTPVTHDVKGRQVDQPFRNEECCDGCRHPSNNDRLVLSLLELQVAQERRTWRLAAGRSSCVHGMTHQSLLLRFLLCFACSALAYNKCPHTECHPTVCLQSILQGTCW